MSTQCGSGLWRGGGVRVPGDTPAPAGGLESPVTRSENPGMSPLRASHTVKQPPANFRGKTEPQRDKQLSSHGTADGSVI